VTWADLEGISDPRELNVATVPARLRDLGDPWQALDDTSHSLDPLLELWAADPIEKNFPPDYPKMPGEPPRVEPSKKVAANWDEEGNRVRGSEQRNGGSQPVDPDVQPRS
jgi:hypothetical protein